MQSSEQRALTHLSLFSGFGGLDLAAEQEGFETVGQCEWADYPTLVLEKHWPDVPRWRDIRTLTGASFYERTGLRTVDVLSGGFPCQPFSVAGQRRGTGDDRYLWPEMLRVIREIRPAWVLGENVAGLLSMAEPIDAPQVAHRTINRYPESDHYRGVYTQQERMLLGTILEEIEACGYEVAVFCIPACGVDAPHKRERLAIIAHANGDRCGTQRPEPAGQQREAWTANGGAALENASGGRWKQPKVLPKQPRGTKPERTSDGSANRRAATVYEDVANALRHGCGNGQAEINTAEAGKHAQRYAAGCGADVADALRDRSAPRVADTQGREERQSTEPFNGGQAVCATECSRLSRDNGRRPGAVVENGCTPATNAHNAGLQIAGQQPRKQAIFAGNGAKYGDWWPAEPRLGRVAYGVPRRVERLKGLGNAAAPPQFRPIYHAIRKVLEEENA